MKIIRIGTVPVLKERRFTCQGCGCVFEAGPEEYRLASAYEQQYDGIEASCKCPCCGETVRRCLEERPEASTGRRCPKCGAWMLWRGAGRTLSGALVIDHGEQFCPGCGYTTAVREAVEHD